MLWKQIPGHSRYEISEFGDVRVAGNAPAWGWRKAGGTLLKPSLHDNRYKYLAINLIPDKGVKAVSKIHQLVALTFIGPKPSSQYCALHKDDNQRNNHYSNLYWGTKQQNAIDRSVNGKHGMAKLNLEDVLWIKELYHGDARTYTELSKMFGVRLSTIQDVINNKTYTWTHWSNAF